MIFHIDQFSHYFGLDSYGFWKTKMQSYAVLLFFVLSGFLITFLLLREKEQTGNVNLRAFYTRRILRTWPVYYLVLIVGAVLLVALPGQINLGVKQNLGLTFVAYALLLPNIASYLGYAPDLINVLWSVGAEEQFYAFWPLMVKNQKAVLEKILLFLVGYIFLRWLLIYFNFPPRAWSLLEYMPFDCMAIGGIAACLYKGNNPLLSIVYHPATQVIAWLFFAASVFYHPLRMPGLGLLNLDVHAVVYAVMILNVSTNKKSIIRLENGLLKFLGKISYGIYGYHFIVLFLLSYCLKNSSVNSLPQPLAHGIMFAAVTGLTILVAYLSNRYFESWFQAKRPVAVS